MTIDVSCLLIALEHALNCLSALESLGRVRTSFHEDRLSRHLNEWGFYFKSWAALYESAQDAMLLVSRMLTEVQQDIDVTLLHDRQLAEVLNRAFAARDRFDRTVKNHRAALAEFERAKSICEVDRSQENLRTKKNADNRRARWYRQLRARFSRYAQTLKALNAMSNQLNDAGEKMQD